MKKQEQNTTKPVSKFSACFQGLQLFLVQSIVCIVAVLIVLLLRVIGGDVFSDLSERFQNAMMNSKLVSSVVSVLDSQTVVAQTPVTVPFAATNATISVSAPITEESTAPTVCAPLTGGVITSHYGSREDPFDDTTVSSHHGVDIAAAEGTPLAALMSGEVTEVDYDENGYGHHVLVKCDDGHEYLYAHCSSINVSVGQRITAGDIIAAVGNTGRSTGSHLHIEWRENGVPVDPMMVLPEQTYA